MRPNFQIPSLFQVVDNWTGDMDITLGAQTVTFTPASQEHFYSAVEILLWLIRRANQDIAPQYSFTAWMSTGGHFVISNTAGSFITVTGTNNTWARMGGVGTYSSSSPIELSAATPHLMQLGALGADVKAYNANWKGGVTTCLGAASTPILNHGGGGTATFMHMLADTYSDEPSLDGGMDPTEVDIWTGKVDLGRFVVENIKRVREDKRARVVSYEYTLNGAML